MLRKGGKPEAVDSYCKPRLGSMDEEDHDAVTAEYSLGKKLSVEYTESGSGLVWNAKRRKELNIWLG